MGSLLLFSHYSRAQNFELPKHRNRNAIPFKFVKNLIIIPVMINDKGPFNFVLDTGIGLILISDYKLADSLKLQNLRNIKIVGLGENESLDAFITPPMSFGVGEARAPALGAAILKKDVFNLSEFVGIPIHGIIGYELFNSFIVRISYNNKTVTLFSNHSGFIPRKGYKIPISIEELKPYIETGVVLKNGEKAKTKLIIDTGAGHPISLENENGIPFPIPEINVAENLGIGLNGPISGYLGRIKSLTLGKYELKNVISAFPNYNDVGAKIQITGRNGNLGNAVLKRFEVVFDYSRSALYLKPSFYFKEPFEHDMTGMELSAAGTDFNRILVNRVAADSPAAIQGISAGDEILSINLKPVSQLSIDEINDLFKSGHDKSFFLEILPKGSEELRKVIFTLKRRI
ncbi:MAG: aspartyl protease family protein [Sphingobacteriaceae bacterium]